MFGSRFSRLESKFDATFDRIQGQFQAMQKRMDSQFRWLVGIQFSVLVTVIGVLLSR